jgi:ascorbate-specific PTS system EIIC-type component UlaA
MSEFIDQHPFVVVGIITLIGVILLNRDLKNAKKHQKHLKEIEKRKALKS